jgi:hypothetical protein
MKRKEKTEGEREKKERGEGIIILYRKKNHTQLHTAVHGPIECFAHYSCNPHLGKDKLKEGFPFVKLNTSKTGGIIKKVNEWTESILILVKCLGLVKKFVCNVS